MTEASRVFLDLDGTLVDPAPGIIGSIRHALAEVGAEVPEADTLSMGMSGDMEAAIAEGATIVRIGTDLFGPRG